jgi:formiminoglutamase
MAQLLARTGDLGDVPVTGDVGADQERLAARLAPHLARGATAVVLGGGHETAFGHFLAHVEAGLRPRILNVDAHPDVREPGEEGGHSGSPFRQALGHPSGACRGYRVAGLQRASVARAHLAFLEEAGAGWRWREDTDAAALEEEVGRLDGPALVSLDLDAVDAAHAPGVSAPATGGVGPRAWLAAAAAAGRSPAVRSLDVVELNPRLDVDGRTARLAAHTVWRFLAGRAERGDGG